MTFNIFKNTVLLFVLIAISCGNKSNKQVNLNDEMFRPFHSAQGKLTQHDNSDSLNIVVGANQTEKYLPLLSGKRVGIVANQTSVIFKDNEIDTTSAKSRNDKYTHVVDSLVLLKVNVTKVFSPEHGFRGNADAGELVKDGIDTKTNLPIASLHGKSKKPTSEQLEDIDVMIFDIQDVGVRFYTYLSTLHYMMEACAENNVPLLVLDRPNPNAYYIDGSVLEEDC